MLAAVSLLLLLWVPFICRFELAGGDCEDAVKKIELRWLFISHTIDAADTPVREDYREEEVRKGALSKNPVISADLLDSWHSFIRDKIGTKRSRMATNDANYANLVARKREKKKRMMDADSAFELVRTLHQPAITLVRRVVRRTGIRELSCRAAFGMDDPAETGILTGFLYAVSSALTQFSDAEVRLRPVFHEQTFAYRTRGSISVTAGRMIVPIFAFISSRPVRGAVVGYIRKRV